MVVHAMGVVVSTHARAFPRHVSRLVNVKSMFSVRHTRDTHALDDDIHSSPVEPILKQYTTRPEKGASMFHFFGVALKKKGDIHL